MANEVVLYTQPGWVPCKAEREFLTQKGIPFVEKDLSKSRSYVDELIRMGARGTPTTLVDGQVIIGFDRKRISEALGIG